MSQPINNLLHLFPTPSTTPNTNQSTLEEVCKLKGVEYTLGRDVITQQISLPTPRPTFDQMSHWFNYNPITGILTWKRSPNTDVSKNDTAGYLTSSDNLKVVFIDAQEYCVHRICWLLHYQDWPDYAILHLNGIRSDNRISNLLDIPYLEHHKYRSERTPKTTSY